MSDRLYVVVRADLPIGLQMAQAIHAALRFGHYVGERENVVVLHMPDEDALASLADAMAHTAGLLWIVFHEPDLDGQVTSLAIDGVASVRKYLRPLPLAFSAPRCASDATDHTVGTGRA